MLAATLVNPVHDEAHHLRMSHCHLLLSAWNIPLGPGEASHEYTMYCLSWKPKPLIGHNPRPNLRQTEPRKPSF